MGGEQRDGEDRLPQDGGADAGDGFAYRSGRPQAGETAAVGEAQHFAAQARVGLQHTADLGHRRVVALGQFHEFQRHAAR